MTTRVVQIGLCTADLSRTIRRYCEGFGFQDAGGRIMWGERTARIQALGDDLNGMVWWLVGSQSFLNLEFFHHSLPKQRLLPHDWKPDAAGWVRWGFAVENFDDALRYLRKAKVWLSDVMTVNGLRRVCFRDPDIGIFVEVMEEGEALLGSHANRDQGPRVVYATLSVPNLPKARAFYEQAMDMKVLRGELHPPEAEALWGLPGAVRDSVLLDGSGGMFLEIVEYASPTGKRASDYRLSDQGIMNIAVGYRKRHEAEDAIARAMAGDATLNAPLGETPSAATYISDPQGNSVEVLYTPEALEGAFGWKPRPPAFR